MLPRLGRGNKWADAAGVWAHVMRCQMIPCDCEFVFEGAQVSSELLHVRQEEIVLDEAEV